MSKPRPSIFRDSLQVSPQRISVMNDEDLNTLMRQLLYAQAHKCSCPHNEIRVNSDGNAKDDGCDGWSAKPTIEDDWLGMAETCWQFKAGTAGEPSRLAGEVTKRIPKETLTDGGRFVVVTSGSTNGKKGEEQRCKKLIIEAANANIPSEKIEVIGSERLACWCNQYPSIAVRWAGRPDGLWSFDEWSNSTEHQVSWYASELIQSELSAKRAELDLVNGRIHHLHIHGLPGVGKTRFALELCREAAWRNYVIYVRQASDIRLNELIDSAVAEEEVRLIIVADEVQADQLRPLRDSIERGGGHIRVITIGHCKSPDYSRIPTVFIKPIESQVMEKIIKDWHPAMPPEHIDFVVRFADGYVRLARLAADAVARNPSINIQILLNCEDIRIFLDGMLNTSNRRELYVVAVLTSVGWTEDKQNEGIAVAKHFGLDWSSVQYAVEDFDRRFGIAPRGGRYRCISPTSLGIYLAVEAWTAHPDLLRSLPNVLPSDESRDAYFERLKSMASNPQAREFAKNELASFIHIDDFINYRKVLHWSALSSADPTEAACNFLRAISNTAVECRQRIKDSARRVVVFTLTRLAWKPSTFHDAIIALALLAEAENETCSNNASGEFIARFQIYLGGTAVPYLDRLPVLDELLEMKNTSLAKLAIKALAEVSDQSAFRIVDMPASDELPEREWQPIFESDLNICVKNSISRLIDVAKSGIADILPDLITTAERLSNMLRKSPMKELVANYFRVVCETYKEAREPLRRIIANIIQFEKKCLKNLSVKELGEIETLHSQFEDSSLRARLQQYVGSTSWGSDEQPDLKSLACEFQSDPDALAENLPWLTSGKAFYAFQFGEALAEVDLKGDFEKTIFLHSGCGPDLRMICGYVRAKRHALSEIWYERWIESQFQKYPRHINLFFDVVFYCGATESLVGKLVEILQNEQVNPQIVDKLEYGQWGEHLTFEVFKTLLRAMVDSGHQRAAIGILVHRIKSHSDEAIDWKNFALELVTTSSLIRSGNITNYYWKEIANLLIKEFPREIAAAIFGEQVNRDLDPWFIENSNAASILHACVKQDPSGVWHKMQPFLSSKSDFIRFSIGFPKGIFEDILPDDVWAWITEKPEERIEIVARLINKNISTDQTLASKFLGKYGDNKKVAEIFYSEYISGSWSGPSSSHWDHLADKLDEVKGRTKLTKLRQWTSDSACHLRKKAEKERQREEEDKLRER